MGWKERAISSAKLTIIIYPAFILLSILFYNMLGYAFAIDLTLSGILSGIIRIWLGGVLLFTIYDFSFKKETSNKKEENKKGLDKKSIAVAIILILAIVFAYVILISQLDNSYTPKGLPADRGQFLLSIVDSKLVYIVMDIRDASAAAKQNILQCGVDFAGSEGLADKEVIAFALDGRQCVTLSNASRPINECLSKLHDAPVLYIKQGEQTIFYQKAAMIGMGENYVLYDCRINVV